MKQHQQKFQGNLKQKSAGVKRVSPRKSYGIVAIVLQLSFLGLVATYFQHAQFVQNIMKQQPQEAKPQQSTHSKPEPEQSMGQPVVVEVPPYANSKPTLRTNRPRFLETQEVLERFAEGNLDSFNDVEFMRNYVCNPNHQYQIQLLSHDPMIMKVKNFLAPGEAEHLQLAGLPHLEKSTVAEVEDVEFEGRTSYTAHFDHAQDAVIACIEKRAAYMTKMPLPNVETLQVVRYQKGQFNNPHHDFFPEEVDGFDLQYERGGQRIITVFTYLNTVPEEMGGRTYFPELNLTIAAEKNTAAFWYERDPFGNMDERTLHGGEVIKGDYEKWGLNIWIREREFV